MDKSAQEQFDELVVERDKLKTEINKWIYKAQKLERERDNYIDTLELLRDAVNSALRVNKTVSKKT